VLFKVYLPHPYVLSRALIGNASGGALRVRKMLILRGVFDKKTRRKPLAFGPHLQLRGVDPHEIWYGDPLLGVLGGLSARDGLCVDRGISDVPPYMRPPGPQG
jgi:hypothetical protein